MVDVQLANFRFTPSTITLAAGKPVTLRLRNSAGGGHNFNAPDLFRSATIDPRSLPLIANGRVEVGKGKTVELTLTPAAGRYPLTCTHTLHRTFGMRGTIVVR